MFLSFSIPQHLCLSCGVYYLPTECMYKLFTTHKVVLILDFKEQMIFSGNDSLKKKEIETPFKM